MILKWTRPSSFILYILIILIKGVENAELRRYPKFLVMLQKNMQDTYNQSIYNVATIKNESASDKDLVNWFLNPKTVNTFFLGYETDPNKYKASQHEKNLPDITRIKKEADSNSGIALDPSDPFEEAKIQILKMVKEADLSGRSHLVEQPVSTTVKTTLETDASEYPGETESTLKNEDSLQEKSTVSSAAAQEDTNRETNEGYENIGTTTEKLPGTKSGSTSEESTSALNAKGTTSTETAKPNENESLIEANVGQVKQVPVPRKADPLIVWITLGCIGIVLITVGGIFYIWHRKERSTEDMESPPYGPEVDKCDVIPRVISHKIFGEV